MINTGTILQRDIAGNIIVIIDRVGSVAILNNLGTQFTERDETADRRPKEGDLFSINLPRVADDIAARVDPSGPAPRGRTVAASGYADVHHPGGFRPDKTTIDITLDIGANHSPAIVDRCREGIATERAEVTHPARGIPEKGICRTPATADGRD